MTTDSDRLTEWDARLARLLHAAWGAAGAADGAHDLAHVQRVVATARRLAAAEGADLHVVLPAAWLHDCVIVAKDSPLRHRASRMAAEQAVQLLHNAGYPAQYLDAIAHAIAAHSFSAQIAPQTIEAKVVQDADRLDALGAIGIARCIGTGVALGRPLYDPAAPQPARRAADDRRSSVDHFYTKLFKLTATLHTAAARLEAAARVAFMHQFLDQLWREIGVAETDAGM